MTILQEIQNYFKQHSLVVYTTAGEKKDTKCWRKSAGQAVSLSTQLYATLRTMVFCCLCKVQFITEYVHLMVSSTTAI